jgi:hypothetical protein
LARYARKVSSDGQACFHGLRPQLKLTRITPSDQMSLCNVEYAPNRSNKPP